MNLQAFADQLSFLMKRADIKRAELARQLDVTIYALNKWLYAQRKPSRSIVIKLIKQFLPYLTVEQADDWAAQVEYSLTTSERELLFFSLPDQTLPPPNPQAIYSRLPTLLGKLFGIEQAQETLLAKLMDQDDYWIIGIDGLGGVGKTALATHLVHTILRTSRFYQVAWVSAKQYEFSAKKGVYPVNFDPALSEEELINQLLNQLHPALSPILPPQEKLSILQRWLKQKPYLIVVDNLETVNDYEALLALIDRLSNPSKFLLTCRLNLAVETGIHCYPLEPLDRESVYEMLWYAGEQRHQKRLATASRGMLEQIYELIGGNPLALNLVVGQLQTLSFKKLIERLQQAVGKKESELYDHIYYDLWEMLSEPARQLLRILMLMQGEPMSDEEIALADNSSPKLNELEWQDALESLHGYSLLITQGDLTTPTYTIHRLTENFLVKKMMPADQKHFQALIHYNLTRFQTDLAQNNLQTIQQKPAHVVRVLQRALPIVELWPAIQSFMTDLAPLMEQWGQWDGWRNLLENSLRLAQQRRHDQSKLQLHILSARLAQRQHRLAEVISHYRQAIRLAKEQQHQALMATAYTNLGYLYIESRFYWRGKILCHEALRVFEHLHHHNGLAHTYNHLGVLHLRQENWDEAERYLQQASDLWRQNNNQQHLVSSQLNLGIIYRKIDEIENSSIYFKKALKHAKAINNQAEMANIYNSLGLNYVTLDYVEQARRSYQQAKTIFHDLSNSLGMGHVMYNLAALAMKQQQWSEAEQYFEAALGYYEQVEHTQHCLDTQQEIAQVRQIMSASENERHEQPVML